MTEQRMKEIAIEIIGGDEISWCNDEKLVQIFEAIKAESGKDGIGGGEWLRLSQAISTSMAFEDGIWTHFTDEQMLKLFKNRIGAELETGKYKESMPSSSTMFHAAQNVFGYATRHKYNKTLEYFMEWADLESVDIDRLAVLSSIKNGNEPAVEMILAHADETYKTQGGTHNAFFYHVKREVNEILPTAPISQDLKEQLKNNFKWIELANPMDSLRKKWEKMSTDELLNVDKNGLSDSETDLMIEVLTAKVEALKSKRAKLEADAN